MWIVVYGKISLCTSRTVFLNGQDFPNYRTPERSTSLMSDEASSPKDSGYLCTILIRHSNLSHDVVTPDNTLLVTSFGLS